MSVASLKDLFLSNTYAKMLNDKDLSDTVFVVQEQKFYGIRSLFAAASPVFKKMLFGSMLESRLQTEEKSDESVENIDNQDDGPIEEDISNAYHKVIITDVNPKAFEFFQNYIYHLNPKMTNEIAVDLMYFCHKYMLMELEESCKEYILNTDAEFVACCISDLIKKYKFIDIATTLLNESKILESSDKFETIFNSYNFIEYSIEILVSLLDNGKSKMKEEEIWQQCVLWAKHSSVDDEDADERVAEMKVGDDDWKARLKLLVPYVRFPLMNVSFFVNNIVRAEDFENGHVLTVDQMMAILCYFGDDKKDKTGLVFSADSRALVSAIGCPFKWDLFHTDNTPCIDNNHHTKLRCVSDELMMFSSETSWTTGVHKWKIGWDDLEFGSGSFKFEIGIVSDATYMSTRINKSMNSALFGDTYFFCKGKCYANQHENVTEMATINIAEGYQYSELTITLDCEQWKVSFDMDDKHGSTIGIVPGQNYFPALCHREGAILYSLSFEK